MKTILKIQKLFFAFGLVAAFFVNDAKATTIFPIATNGTVSQAGFSAAFSGTNYLVGIEGDAVNPNAITAQLISTNGSLVGSRIAIGGTGGSPYVGFDGTNFLLVWPDDRLLETGGNDQIYGQRVSQSGALVGSPFTFGPTDEYQNIYDGEWLAFDGRNYLIVDQVGTYHDIANDYIKAWLTSPSGSLVVPVISISSTSACPAVVFGRTNYLVVWHKKRATGPELYDIYGEFISTNGTQGSAFIISQTPTPSYNPGGIGIVFDGINFFVVWNKDMGPGNPSPSDFDIYGRFVSPAGSFGNEIALVTGAGDQMITGGAFDGANYLFSWGEGGFGSTNSQIVFQFFNPSAVAIGLEFTLFSPQGTNAPMIGGVFYGGGQFVIIGIIGGYSEDFTGGTGTYGTFLSKSTASPMLTASNRVGTQFPLQLTGTPGINYAIQISTNLALSNWTAVVTDSPTNGTFSFTDTHATNASRFYRAVKQ
jgi:hypothetical protein